MLYRGNIVFMPKVRLEISFPTTCEPRRPVIRP